MEDRITGRDPCTAGAFSGSDEFCVNGASPSTLFFSGEATTPLFLRAAAAPWDGYNALAGVIQTFNAIDAARVHFRDGARVHGIITEGGKAANIIPETAQAVFSVRAFGVDELASVTERIVACATAAAVATGTRVETSVRRGYRNCTTI